MPGACLKGNLGGLVRHRIPDPPCHAAPNGHEETASRVGEPADHAARWARSRAPLGPVPGQLPRPGRTASQRPGEPFLAKQSADQWLAMRQAEIVAHKWKPHAPCGEDGPPTLADHSDLWLQTRRTRSGEQLKPRTRDLYGVLLKKQILPVLGAQRISEITPRRCGRVVRTAAALRAEPTRAPSVVGRDHAHRRHRAATADR
jgi:hypothetical protein